MAKTLKSKSKKLAKPKVKDWGVFQLPTPVSHTPMTLEEYKASLPQGNPQEGREGPQETSGLHFSSDPSPRTSQVMIVEPDPLAGAAGLIFVLAGQRMLSFARSYPQEANPEEFVRSILARLVMKDPLVKLLVAVSDGEIVGHVLGVIEGAGSNRWVFCYQAQVDARGTDVLQQMIDLATPWAKSQGAQYILMATQIDPDFWQKRYNFQTVRHVMRREI